MEDDRHAHKGPRPVSTTNWILIGFLLIIGYFLVMEHKAHLEGVRGYLPYLLLLACPFMHFFMHHGHGGHWDATSRKDDKGEQT